MSRRKFAWLLGAVFLGVTVITALGVEVRATYGAQTTADEPQYLLSAMSLWEDGDLDISDELGDERYRDFHEVPLPAQTEPLPDGRHISPHDPLLPLLLAVPIGLGGWVGAKLFLAGLGGLLAASMVWVAHRRLGARPSTALAVVGAFSLAPPLAIYATQVYPEVAAALAVTAGIAALLGPPRPLSVMVAVAAVVVLPWLAVKYVPVALVLAVAALRWASGPARKWLLATLAAAGAVYVAAHLALYGGLTAYAAGDHFVGGEFTAVGVEPDWWARSSRLIGLLVDRGFGLAAWQPAFLLVPLAAAHLMRRRTTPSALLVALLAAGWLSATFLALTMHGWWFPGRQLVVVLPAAVLLVARWAEGANFRLFFAAGLGAVGVGAFAFLLAQGGAGDLTWVVDFGSTNYPPYRLYSGLLPDYMDPSPATWLLHGAWLAVLIVLMARQGISHPAPVWRPKKIERERHAT